MTQPFDSFAFERAFAAVCKHFKLRPQEVEWCRNGIKLDPQKAHACYMAIWRSLR
jgi:hypothetical protein